MITKDVLDSFYDYLICLTDQLLDIYLFYGYNVDHIQSSKSLCT